MLQLHGLELLRGGGGLLKVPRFAAYFVSRIVVLVVIVVAVIAQCMAAQQRCLSLIPGQFLQGMQCPELLGSEFTHLEFVRRPVRSDLGKRLLCRDAFMTGW